MWGSCSLWVLGAHYLGLEGLWRQRLGPPLSCCNEPVLSMLWLGATFLCCLCREEDRAICPSPVGRKVLGQGTLACALCGLGLREAPLSSPSSFLPHRLREM